MQPPPPSPGRPPWRVHARHHRPWPLAGTERLALAPPHWAEAAPSRPSVRGLVRRAALLAAATCSFAAIARAQVATGGGDSGGGTAAPAGGGGAAAGSTAAAAATAPDATPGSLRATVENALPGVNAPLTGATTTPAWVITPGLSLQEEWTDNALNSAPPHQASLITLVSPSISINGATSRLTADLYYAPSVELYSQTPSQNQLGQNFGGDALLTLAPEEFYVKATGFAGLQSISGATAPEGTAALPKQNQLQTYDFSIEPYLMHRFGGWGTAQVGVMASQFTANAVGGGGTVQDLTTKEVFGSFTSGENFGRMSNTVTLSATQDDGTGGLQGASQTLANYQVGYAITHSIIALASIGWENIRYGAGAPSFDDATWSAGAELLPNADSSITITYGHQDGATAAAVNGSYAPTATIRLTAQYQAGVSTAAQTLNNALGGATFDASGHPVSATTGAPLLPASNFFGFNGTVYQSKTLALSASWLLPRDAFQATFTKQTQTPIGSTGTIVLATASNTQFGTLTLAQGLAASSGSFGSLSWQHDLSPVVASTLTGTYGVLSNYTPITLTNGVLTATGKESQNATVLSVTAGLNWQMTRTLTGTLLYSYTNNDYSNGLAGVATNLVVLGLNKTF